MPDLRIVDQKLWEAVKARQSGIRQKIQDNDGQRPERARRVKYLFSGMLVCGCCGGGYTLVGKTQYGCATRRNKGTCDNRLTIKRETLEETVLAGLKDQLLHPDLIAEFVKEYQKEYNRLVASEVGSRRSKESEYTKVKRQIDQIINAITEGLYTPTSPTIR